MARYAKSYKIKIIDDDQTKPKFVFFGLNNEVVEELPLINMTEEEILQALKERGVRIHEEL